MKCFYTWMWCNSSERCSNTSSTENTEMQRHTHEPQAYLGLCLSNSDLSTATSPPQMCTETQWPGSTEQVSSHPCTNVPNEILSICGGNLQPETGWLQTRGAADHRDGWGRWFVECLKHKSKHLFSVTWEFLFSASSIFSHLQDFSSLEIRILMI